MKFVARITRKMFPPKPPVDLRERRAFLGNAAKVTGAAVLLPGGLAALLSACKAQISKGVTNPGKNFVELTLSDLSQIVKRVLRDRDYDACEIKTEKDLEKFINKNQGRFATEIARQLVNEVYGTDYTYGGKNKIIFDRLKELAPNQKAEVIKQLAASAEMGSTITNFKDNLSKDQWEALRIQCLTSETDMAMKFGGKIVLKGVTKAAVLKIIKEVKGSVKAAAGGGAAEPEVVICDIDDTKAPFIPYEIQRGQEKTLHLRGEAFHTSTDAKIKLDFGKGVDVVSSKATTYGFEVTIKVSKNSSKAPLGNRTLTISVDGTKVKEVKPALIINPAPQKVAKAKVKKKAIRKKKKKKAASAMKARPRATSDFCKKNPDACL